MKLNIFSKTRDAKNFFDYPAKERKKIIKKATEEANKKQLNLVKRYNSCVCNPC